MIVSVASFFFFQAEDGFLDAQESRGLGAVYQRQLLFILPPGAFITLGYLIAIFNRFKAK